MLLGRPRTGSSFLRSLLDSHPQVRVHGELFSDQPRAAFRPHLPERDDWLELLREAPVRFLEEVVFAPPGSGGARAVGFKLFYRHARTGKARRAWKWLAAHRGLRVLHLKRRNVLAAHLSYRRAEITGVWKISDDHLDRLWRREGRISFPLTYDECRKTFEQTERDERAAERLFAHHPMLEIHYEDLCERRREVLGMIQDFLEVDRKPPDRLRPETRRQSMLPIEVEISNYQELAERFRGSRWERFFKPAVEAAQSKAAESAASTAALSSTGTNR